MPGRTRQANANHATLAAVCSYTHTRSELGALQCSGGRCSDTPFEIIAVNLVEPGVLVDFTVTYRYHGRVYTTTHPTQIGCKHFNDPNRSYGPMGIAMRLADLNDMAAAAATVRP